MQKYLLIHSAANASLKNLNKLEHYTVINVMSVIANPVGNVCTGEQFI
jgi:hypothetical protein